MGKRRSAANLAAAAGDGPSPNTREGTRKSPSNGDPLPGKKVDGWKKGMPSCGVASGAAKAERKHSVRAAQAHQGQLEPQPLSLTPTLSSSLTYPFP